MIQEIKLSKYKKILTNFLIKKLKKILKIILKTFLIFLRKLKNNFK
jgi:hypothetical protein